MIHHFYTVFLSIFPGFYKYVCADECRIVQNRNNAQSSCAGLFICANLGFDFAGSWIHVDMASPVYCVSF